MSWVKDMDKASADGDIFEITTVCETVFDGYNLMSGKVIGDRKKNIDDENNFCDPDKLTKMLNLKSSLDNKNNFRFGRNRSNPYEKIGSGIFLNRSAMKMVNLDHIFGNLCTNISDNEILFFADLCGGPGGFTEFILWKRPLKSCGFGITLREKDDFQLQNIVCGPVECFHPSYGKTEDGNIMNEDNLKHFQLEVLQGTCNMGVQTVMGDGAFDVTGMENIQELLSKQLCLCQFLCAINILRIDGNFVCNLFDTLTDFTVGLIYLLSSLFSEVSIVKPITSRPANSERFIVFKNFTRDESRVEKIRKFLYEINRDLHELKETDKDVIEIIQRSVLKEDEKFYEFITDINNRILDHQIIALNKLINFIDNSKLRDERQINIKKEAFELWKIPNLKRDYFQKGFWANSTAKNFISFESNQQDQLKLEAQKPIFSLSENGFRDEKFVRNHMVAAFIGRQVLNEMCEPLCVMVKGNKYVEFYPTTESRPKRLELKDWFTSIPSFTILLVNFALENCGPTGTSKSNSVIVVDSPLIYGEDISKLSYEDRMHKVARLCSLLDPKLTGMIRPIDYFPLSGIKDYVWTQISEKNLVSCKNTDHLYSVGKLVIIKIINDTSTDQASANATTRYSSYSKSNIYLIDYESKDDKFDCIKLLSLIN